MGSAVEIRVLGSLEVVGADGPVRLGAPKQRRLLAALALHAGQVRPDDVLLEAIWGASPPPSAAKLLQVYASQLRKALPSPIRIDRLGTGYALVLEPDGLDAARFERLLADGRAAFRAGNAVLAASLLSRALALWRGPAYADFAFDEFARLEAERLEESRLVAQEERLEAELALGRHADAIAEVLSLAAANPLRERLQAQAMLALYRSGRQSEALEHYAATRRHLRDELGLEPGDELQKLQRRVLHHDPELTAATPAHTSSGDLPSPPNTLLGRERELAQVGKLLLRDDVRLLVLTGAGGSGKTRLALEAVRAAAPSFANGAVFVPLASVRDPELVAAAIARALALEHTVNQDAARAVGAELSGQELLLLVDNAEHLRAAAPLFVELLAQAPRLTILVTSRVVLHLSGEHVYPVEPLADEAATALFLARAREAEPRYTANADDEEAIHAICRRLDGLPLAVELAAGHIRTLDPSELASRLTPRLPLLAGGPRDLPARQQTLQATLAWSYELLPIDGQRDFRRLATFTGGCTLEAAEAVCEIPLASLSELVDHNLVFRVTSDSGSRYAMLETIHEFALARLVERGEQHAVARAHADYFLALAERAERTGEAAYAPGWLERLDAEQDNFRAAINWTLDAGEPLVALRMLTALTGLWTVRGVFREWGDWLTQALAAAPDASAELRAVALRDLAAAVFFMGDHERAVTLSEQALELFRQAGDTGAVASMLDRLAAPARMTGDLAKARALADESLALFRQLGDRHGALYPLSKVAWDEWQRGDPAAGVELGEEALELAREFGDTWWQASLLPELAEMHREFGDRERATAAARECLTLARDLADPRIALLGLATLALLAADDRDVARAGRLWGAVERLEANGEAKLDDNARAKYRRALEPLVGQEHETAIAAGHADTLDRAIAYALAQPNA